MAAYRRVYDSRHLQADCQERDQLRSPTLRSRVWATCTFLHTGLFLQNVNVRYSRSFIRPGFPGRMESSDRRLKSLRRQLPVGCGQVRLPMSRDVSISARVEGHLPAILRVYTALLSIV